MGKFNNIEEVEFDAVILRITKLMKEVSTMKDVKVLYKKMIYNNCIMELNKLTNKIEFSIEESKS